LKPTHTIRNEISQRRTETILVIAFSFRKWPGPASTGSLDRPAVQAGIREQANRAHVNQNWIGRSGFSSPRLRIHFRQSFAVCAWTFAWQMMQSMAVGPSCPP